MPTRKQRDRTVRMAERIDKLKDKIMQAIASEMKRNEKLDDRHARAALLKAVQIETNFRFIQIKYGGDSVDEDRRPRVGDTVRHIKVPAWGKGLVLQEDDFAYVVRFSKKPGYGTARAGFLDLKLV